MAQLMSGDPEWYLDLSCSKCGAWFRAFANDFEIGIGQSAFASSSRKRYRAECPRCGDWYWLPHSELPGRVTAEADARERGSVAGSKAAEYRATHSGTRR